MLLHALEQQASTSLELAERTQKRTEFVNVYLIRLKRYKLAEKIDDYAWHLTDFGRQFVKDRTFTCLLYNNIYHSNNRTTTQQQHENNRYRKIGFKQLSITAWTRKSNFSECERRVVEVLVAHYNETGSKFLYFNNIYDLAEKFEVNPSDVNQILMNLKQDHVVYSLKDQAHNAIKVGLYKAFVAALEAN